MKSKITIAYVRVSTAQQTEGNGPAQQKASIGAYAALNGLKIDEWVCEDESGTIEDREQILLLKARAEAGELGSLIIDRMDRLGRRLVVCESLHEFFTSHGVEIVCVQARLDSSPAGTMTRQIMGAIAEFQRTELLNRMAQCRMASRKSRGLNGGGQVAYGYKCAGSGKLVIDTASAAMVKRAFELYDRPGGCTLASIVTQLHSEGFRTRKGTKLHSEQIKRILSRRDIYEGKAIFGHVALDAGVTPQQPGILRANERQQRRE